MTMMILIMTMMIMQVASGGCDSGTQCGPWNPSGGKYYYITFTFTQCNADGHQFLTWIWIPEGLIISNDILIILSQVDGTTSHPGTVWLTLNLKMETLATTTKRCIQGQGVRLERTIQSNTLCPCIFTNSKTDQRES